ncbi:MAG: acyl-CoA reductase, partial [Acetobacteraceae bacterium]
MTDLLQLVDTPQQIVAATQRLRAQARREDIPPLRVMEILERWGEALTGPEVDSIPGVAFLRLWLRRGTLEPIVARELGSEALHGKWREERGARLRAFPVGVVGHWPAGNIEIQPMLSLTCGLLGGNASLVRVPSDLVTECGALIEKLCQTDAAGNLTGRIFLAAFGHERTDLHQAMASVVDGAMIWGGAEAVTQIRSLPFPHWARIAVFGPLLSVAAMDADSWDSPREREAWCRRIARDVWQFDQQACSSAQVLFLERRAGANVQEFVAQLAEALRAENRVHPRASAHPAMTSAICLSRASWLLGNTDRSAVFPPSPDWTILLGEGADIPTPTQGRTLTVLMVENLLEPIARFDGSVQTLGLAVTDTDKEAALTHAAGRCGVDRIVKLGRMHVFGSPWDGADVVRP